MVQDPSQRNGFEFSPTRPVGGQLLDAVLADVIIDADQGGGDEAAGMSGVGDFPEAGDVEEGTGPDRIPPDRLDPTGFTRSVGLPLPARPIERGPIGMDTFSDAVLDELAAEVVGWPGPTVAPPAPIAPPPEPGGGLARLAATLIVAGAWGYRAGFRNVDRRQAEGSHPR